VPFVVVVPATMREFPVPDWARRAFVRKNARRQMILPQRVSEAERAEILRGSASSAPLLLCGKSECFSVFFVDGMKAFMKVKRVGIQKRHQ
jgi:hypothetical protein